MLGKLTGIRFPAAILLLLPLSCQESLPPQEQPPVALRASLEVLSFGPYVTIRNGAPTGTAGAFQIGVTDVYDDVLQDSATVEATLEIWLKEMPAIRTTVTATIIDLTTPQFVQRNIMTLEPDSTAVILKQWAHRDQDSIPFWEYVSTRLTSTTGGIPFCESDPVHFVVRGSVRLFRYSPPIIFPEQEFSIVYQVFDLPCDDTGPTGRKPGRANNPSIL
jgi:hypothetical protein